MSTDPYTVIAQAALAGAAAKSIEPVRACHDRDGDAITALVAPLLADYGSDGAFAVAGTLTTAFVRLTGLLDAAGKLPPQSSALFAVVARDDGRPIFGDGGYPARLALAQKFIERFLSEHDWLSFVEVRDGQIDVVALLGGLAEMVAAVAVRRKP